MKLSKRIWIWCKRIRHLNGFGVQSPYAFSFIHSVIYKKLPANLRQHLSASQASSHYHIAHPLPGKTARLLYKAARYNNPVFAVYIEKEFTGGAYYLAEGCQSLLSTFLEQKTKISPITGYIPLPGHLYCGNLQETVRRKLQFHAYVDLIYIDLNVHEAGELCELLIRRCRPDSLLIAGNIHAGKKNLDLWHKMSFNAQTGISFDLYEVGIILFDRHYHQRQYIVNFEGCSF